MVPDPLDPLRPVEPLEAPEALEPPPAVPRPPGDVGPLDHLRDHLARLRDDPRAGAVVLVLVALAAGLVWYRAALSRGADPPSDPQSVAAAGAPGGAEPTTSTTGPALFVHVAGAVTVPGLYELPPGARVADALERAGGIAADADVDRLNLAAPLGDGQRVYVPRVGEPTPPEPAPQGGTAAPGAPASGPVNLNTAGAAELEALPGIGPAIAEAIVAERARRPFRSVDDLLRVRGIGEARLAELRPHVTV